MNTPHQLGFFDPIEPEFSQRIRRTIHNGEMVYSLVDIMAEFTDLNTRPDILWKRTKARLTGDGFQPDQNVIKLKMPAADGKMRLTEVANGETCLRIVQSIPSPKAESMRRWFASLAFERLEEAVTPGLGSQRARRRDLDTLKRHGYSDHEAVKFLELRIQGIDTLTALKATIQDVCSDTPQYGQIINAEYIGLFGGVAKQLQAVLNTKDIREHLPPTQYLYLQTAESSLRDILKHQGTMPNGRIVELATRICTGLGDQLKLMCDALGVDRVTGRPLLNSTPQSTST